MDDDPIECEFCEVRFGFGNDTVDALRATIHAYIQHRRELREWSENR